MGSEIAHSGLAGMCGKFTAMTSWSAATELWQTESDRVGDGEVVFRVMNSIPLIVWDRQGGRCVIWARWGFPDSRDWRRPKPIHARAETVDRLPIFAPAFLSGMRGIALVRTFNEAPESGDQHIIAPDIRACGIAFLFRHFEIGASLPLIAAVMVTVPANGFLARLPADRMPAILDPADWAKWIGEEPATMEDLKGMLRTVEGVNWKMTREMKSVPRTKATVSDPVGLF